MTPRPRALVTAPLRGPGFDKLRELADVIYDPWIDKKPLRIYTPEQLAERTSAEGADVLVVESDSVGGAVFELPLRAIASTRGDPINVDIAGATAAGIPVLHTPGRNADAVAEMTVALLFAVNRHLRQADIDIREGQTYRDGTIPYQRFRAWQLAGATAGLIGLGAVGRATKWRLEGLGMKVIAADTFAPDATHSVDDLLAEADVVSMHTAVTPDSMGLMSAERFMKMKEGSIYVNSARAGLHDLDGLVAALEAGRLAGAGLDHFEGENIKPDHPLLQLPNVVTAPHIGGATYNTETNHTTLMADGLAALLNGETPANIVNAEVLK